MALVGLTAPYVASNFFGKDLNVFGSLTMLAENPTADFGPGYYSDINLRFWESNEIDLFDTLPKEPLNAKKNGITSIKIALSDEAERSSLQKETALMQTEGVTNSSSLGKYIYEERDSDVSNAVSDWMKYIKFQQTNIYLRGTAVDDSADETA